MCLAVPIRNAKEIAGMRVACRLAREIIDKAHAAVQPGVTTDEIDRIVSLTTVIALHGSSLNKLNCTTEYHMHLSCSAL